MGSQQEALHGQGTCQTHAVSSPKCDEMPVFIACSQADFVCLFFSLFFDFFFFTYLL